MIVKTTEVFKLTLDGIFRHTVADIEKRKISVIRLDYCCYHCQNQSVSLFTKPIHDRFQVKYVREVALDIDKSSDDKVEFVSSDLDFNDVELEGKSDLDFRVLLKTVSSTNDYTNDKIEEVKCNKCGTVLKKMIEASSCSVSSRVIDLPSTVRKVEYSDGKVSYIINGIAPRYVYTNGRLFNEKLVKIISKTADGKIYLIPKKVGDFRVSSFEVEKVFTNFRRFFDKESLNFDETDYHLSRNPWVKELFAFADLGYGRKALAEAVNDFSENVGRYHMTNTHNNGLSVKHMMKNENKNAYRRICRNIKNGKIKEVTKMGIEHPMNKDLRRICVYFTRLVPSINELLDQGYKDQEIVSFIREIVSTQEIDLGSNRSYEHILTAIKLAMSDVRSLKRLTMVTYSNSKALTTVKRIYNSDKNTYRRVRSDISDTLRMLDYVMERVEGYRFPRNITPETHDIVMKSYNDLQALEAVQRKNRDASKKLHTLPDMKLDIETEEGFFIHEPTEGRDLIICGVQMNICVGSYVHSIGDGRHVFMLCAKDENPTEGSQLNYVACLEVSGTKEVAEPKDDMADAVSEVFAGELTKGSDLKLVQAKLKSNARVHSSEKIKALVIEFCTKNSIDFSECYDMIKS
jgi:Zn finger protein HypA/HybF involved in hydrogenase expression